MTILTAQKLEELGTELYNALKLRSCTCRRRFPYSGEGVDMCNRCKVLIAWEERNGDKSETLRVFECKFI